MRILRRTAALLLIAAALLASAWDLGLIGAFATATSRGPLYRASSPPVAMAVVECPGSPTDPRWREIAGALGATFRSADASRLLEEIRGPTLLVLPGTPCLTRNEKRRIVQFVDGGGGLLATGAAGREPEETQEWEFLEELSGAEGFQPLSPEAPGYVSLPAGSPLTVGAGGERLTVEARERFSAVALGPHPYWSDAGLAPLDPSLPSSYQVAALHAERGRGRVAWLGFDDLATEPRLTRVAGNALAWAAGAPRAEVRAWPAPFDSAAVVLVNLAATPQNAGYAATALLDSGLRGTFLVPRWFLEEQQPLPANLSASGELALGDISPVQGNAGLRALGGLVLTRARLRWAQGRWPTGARADALEPETARLLALAGIDHVVQPGPVDSVFPRVTEVTQRWGALSRTRRVVRLPQVADDDLNLSPLGLTGLRHEWIVRRIQADRDIYAALGGVYLLLVHTQGLSAAEHVGSLSAVLEDWSDRPIWVATAAELAGWWLKRDHLALEVEQVSPLKLSLTIVSGATETVLGVAVDVHTPEPRNAPWRLTGEEGCRLESRPDPPIRILFPELEPGHGRSCTLELPP